MNWSFILSGECSRLWRWVNDVVVVDVDRFCEDSGQGYVVYIEKK